MKTKIIIGMIIAWLLGLLAGSTFGFELYLPEPRETTQAERQQAQKGLVLQELEIAIKEEYYAWRAGETGQKKRVLRLIREYNNCFYGDICR